MPKWVIITSFAIVVAIGGLVYYIFTRTPQANAPGEPLHVVVKPGQKIGNPLLTASSEQFGRWFPTHCQADLYFRPTNNAHIRDVCILNVTKRVESITGVRLSRDDIFSPEVLMHWKQVKGVQ